MLIRAVARLSTVSGRQYKKFLNFKKFAKKMKKFNTFLINFKEMLRQILKNFSKEYRYVTVI